MDQFYYESGYIDEKYHVYVADVTAGLAPYIEENYFESDYFEAGGALFELMCDAEILSGVTVEASGTWSSEIALTVDAGRVFSQLGDLASAFSVDSQASKTVDAAITVDALFTPGLSVEVFKNSTAVLDSVATMSSDGVATRSANVLLEHIADLNAMAAKTVDITSTATSAFTQSSAATAVKEAQAEITCAFTQTTTPQYVQLADAQLASSASLSADGYITNKRPRKYTQVGSPTLSTSSKKFGAASLLASTTSYVQVPASTQLNTWRTIDLWVNHNANGLGGTVPLVGRGSDWVFYIQDQSTAGQFRVGFQNGSNNAYTTIISGLSETWTHLRVGRIDASPYFRFWINGVEYNLTSNFITTATLTSTAPLSVGWSTSGWGGNNTQVYIDELLITDQVLSTSNFTPPTGPWQPSDQSQIQLLSHFDTDYSDDIGQWEQGQAALTTAATLSAGVDPLVKSAEIALATSTQFTADFEALNGFSADLVVDSALTFNGGLLKGITSDQTVTTTVDATAINLRGFDSQVLSLFTPSVDVVATKVGETVLNSAFSLTADAESFTNAQAALTSSSTVECSVDGITRPGAATIATASSLTATVGFLKSGDVTIADAFDATVNVEYFEGTALLAPMTATMSVTPRKYAGITKTLTAVSTLTAIQYVTPLDSDYPITDRALIHFDGATPVDVYGGTITYGGSTSITGKFSNASGYPVSAPSNIQHGSTFTNLFSKSQWTVDFWFKPRDMAFGSSYTWPATGILALSSVAQSGTYQTDGPDQNLMIGWTQNSLVSSGTATGHFWFGTWAGPIAETGNIAYSYNTTTHEATNFKHIAVSFENLGSNVVRVKIYVDGILSASTTGSETPAYLTTPSLVMMPTIYRIPDRDTLGSYTQSFKGWIDELRFNSYLPYSGNFTPESVAYNPNVYYSAAGANLFAQTGLGVDPLNVQFGQAGLQSSSQLTALNTRTRRTGLTAAIVANTAVNAGKQVSAAAALTTTVTMSTVGRVVRSAASTLTSTASTATNGNRIRYNTSDLESAFTQVAQGRAITSASIPLESSFDIAADNLRVRYADTSFEAIATELAAAAKNATGTVSLEAVSELSITANKTADEPHSISSEFTQTADLDRIRYADSAISVTAALTSEAERVQPAGSDMSAEFTQATNTDQSKIVGFDSSLAIEFAQTVDADRIRNVVEMSAGEFTLTADNQILRLANANIASQFTILASPTFIVRITADFVAFDSVLTIGDVINIDPFLQIRVRQETRVGTVLPELRAITVDQESRVNIIQG